MTKNQSEALKLYSAGKFKKASALNAIAMAIIALAGAMTGSPSFAMHPVDPTIPHPPVPPVDCSKYPTPLTGEKFLQLYSTIATHGDLRDVPFIEKTLQVKFNLKYAVLAGKQDVHWGLYEASSILGTPLHVSLTTSDDDDFENKSGSAANITFTSTPQNYLSECLKITWKQLAQAFPEEKTPFRREKAGPFHSITKTLDGEGENPKITVYVNLADQDYRKTTEDSVIKQFSIGQAK